jgi:hypothetical protein
MDQSNREVTSLGLLHIDKTALQSFEATGTIHHSAVRNITEDSEIRVSKFRWETEVFRAVTIVITALNLRNLSDKNEETRRKCSL